jgi:hypothetical protein
MKLKIIYLVACIIVGLALLAIFHRGPILARGFGLGLSVVGAANLAVLLFSRGRSHES